MAVVQVRRRDAALAAAQAVLLAVALLHLDRAPAPPPAAPPAVAAPASPSAPPAPVPEPAAPAAPVSRERVLCRTTVPGPRTGERGYVLRGCVADEDGRPAPARIAVAHDDGFFEFFSRVLVVTFSFGTVCFVAHDCLGADHPSLGTATDAQGQFRLVLPATADAGRTGHDRVFVQLAGGRAVAETRFKIRQAGVGDTVLEPFVAWTPNVSLGPRSVAFTPLRGDGSYVLEVDGDRGGPFALPVSNGSRFDPHLFPPGRNSVSLRTGLGHATYRAAPVTRQVRERPWPAAAACTVTDRRAKATGVPACGLTDGVWDASALDPVTVCGERYVPEECLTRGWWVTTDLGRVRPVRDLVVAARCSSPRSQVSVDGRRWTAWAALGPVGSDVVSAPRATAVPVRYVRTSCDALTELGEVSAFG